MSHTCDRCHSHLRHSWRPCIKGGHCSSAFDSDADRELYNQLDDGLVASAYDHSEIRDDEDGQVAVATVEDDDGKRYKITWTATKHWEPYPDDRGGGEWRYEVAETPSSVEELP